MYRDRRAVLSFPRHWEKVDTDWIDIIILEDIFGQFDLDHDRLQEWMVHLPTIQEHVDAGKLRVIITTRADIMSKAYSKIGSIKLFSDDLSLTLSSELLNHSEKMSILNRQLRIHKKNMKEDKKVKCITNFRGLNGFPQCCSLFAMDSKLFDRGPGFFKSPEKFFVEVVTKLENTRFLALAFLFCNGEIFEEYLSSETMPQSSKCLLMDLASNLNISKKMASITLLRDAYNSFLELYVVKTMSYKFELMFRGEKPCIHFTHAAVCEAVGQVLGDRCLEMLVKHGDSEYLYQKTYTADVQDSTSRNVFLPVSVYGLLAERMVHDIVEEGLVRSVVKHSALKQPEFVMKLKVVVHKCNSIIDFFMTKRHSTSVFDYTLSEGDCITFMQYILQSDKDVVRLVYSQFLEFLACEHKKNNYDCWKCGEKQNLLELALYYNHFQTADELLTMNACYTHVSLCNAARHGDLSRVQTILETLKRGQVFNPGCKEAEDTLFIAYISGNQNLIELLLNKSIKLDSRHVVDAVQYGDIDVLRKVVEYLKCNKWTSGQDLFCACEREMERALVTAYCIEKFDIADYLLKNKVKVPLYFLVYVARNHSPNAVARMIQDLKVTNSWDPQCCEVRKALLKAYRHAKYDVCDRMFQEGVSLTMTNLPEVVVYSRLLESVKKAIQHLKSTNKWDPKCCDASKSLEKAYIIQEHDVCELLVQEGVSLTMKNLHGMIHGGSSESVRIAIQHLTDTGNWDPKCGDAFKQVNNACYDQMYDLLVQEGISGTMKTLCNVVFNISCESVNVKKAIQHLKDIDSWDPKSGDTSEAFVDACRYQKYLCELLIQEWVSLIMKNLPDMVDRLPLESMKKAIEHLKATDNWDPKCDDASEAVLL